MATWSRSGRSGSHLISTLVAALPERAKWLQCASIRAVLCGSILLDSVVLSHQKLFKFRDWVRTTTAGKVYDQ